MARTAIARPGGKGIREIDLVFERVTEKPVKRGNEWIVAPVEEEQFALYRDVGAFPKKMYFSRDEAEELFGLIAEELNLKVRFESNCGNR